MLARATRLAVTTAAALLTSSALGQGATCASATVVTVGGMPFTNLATFANQTHSGAYTGTIYKAGWFAFTPSVSGLYDIDVCGCSVDSKLSIGTTCPSGAFAAAFYNDDSCAYAGGTSLYASKVSAAALTAGTRYYIAVGSFGSTTAPCVGTLTISPPLSPWDACAPANVVTGAVGANVVTINSSAQPLDMAGYCAPSTTGDAKIHKAHYIRFVASTTGAYKATTCAQSTDTRLAAMTACGDPSTVLVCNDDHGDNPGGGEGTSCPVLASAVTFSTVAGQAYYLAVGGYSATTSLPATLTVTIGQVAAPPNPCDPANMLDGATSPIAVVPESNYPDLDMTGFCSAFTVGTKKISRAKYIRYTAPVTGLYTIGNCGDTTGSVDARMAVLTQCGVASTSIACDDDGCTAGMSPYTAKMADVQLVGGVTYYIAVGGYSATTAGPFTVEITAPAGNPCPCDLDGNGTVNGADLGIVLGNWGNSGIGDINQDGTVNGADLGALLGAFGPCP